ncbi:hypothetical protein BDK51DRAFT_47740 [Blyttiomyces helicus]|uniref:Anaphase-promoting complex subunit 5 n=1 Tax=Blyttiomyces helicus TaxID=388810 RepID=A0A4V1IRK3_9FUNG|nr:hypothetical protein BDK51DRAFT_47740 [Blyttiomyces helicus]|eukprot:RKO90357.1 hypothetical protein BDK51DRAFT_47740 [Blyttiomyces helicus]
MPALDGADGPSPDDHPVSGVPDWFTNQTENQAQTTAESPDEPPTAAPNDADAPEGTPTEDPTAAVVVRLWKTRYLTPFKVALAVVVVHLLNEIRREGQNQAAYSELFLFIKGKIEPFEIPAQATDSQILLFSIQPESTARDATPYEPKLPTFLAELDHFNAGIRVVVEEAKPSANYSTFYSLLGIVSADFWMVLARDFCKFDAFHKLIVRFKNGDFAAGTLALFNIETFVEGQSRIADRAQAFNVLSETAGSNLPGELFKQLQNVSWAVPNLPEINLLRYLTCLKTKEFRMAHEAILKAYELPITGQGQRERSRSLHHYTALSLAVLYLRFNHGDYALEMLKEALPLIFKAEDAESLTKYSEVYLQCEEPPQSAQTASRPELLESLIAAAKDREEHDRECSAELSKAVYALATRRTRASSFASCPYPRIPSQGSSPTIVFESLQRARSIAAYHNLNGHDGRILLVSASAWEAFGNPRLAAVDAAKQIEVFGDETAPSDAALGWCKLAFQEAANGEYKKAFDLLQKAKDRYPAQESPAAVQWIGAGLMIFCDMSLLRNALSSARVACDELEAFAEEYVEFRKQARFRRALYARRSHDPEMESNMEIAARDADVALKRANDALLRADDALALATSNYLSGHHARALVLRARALSAMGHPTEALSLLRDAPEMYYLADRADAFAAVAQCELARATNHGVSNLRA